MSLFRHLQGTLTKECFIPGQGTAGTTDDWALWVPAFDVEILAAKWVPNAAMTAHGTNYCSLLVKQASTTMATRSWAATDSVALTAETMTLSTTSSDLMVASGTVVAASKTVASSGLGLVDGTIQIHYRFTGV